MSLLDKLLQTDAGKLTEQPHAKFEIERLSTMLKTKFELDLSAVEPKRYAEIQRMGIDIGKKGNVRDVNVYEMRIMTLLEGIKAPDLKDKELLKHLNVVTPKELVGKLFLSGEIDDICKKIDELSGYEKDDDEVDEEIKN